MKWKLKRGFTKKLVSEKLDLSATRLENVYTVMKKGRNLLYKTEHWAAPSLFFLSIQIKFTLLAKKMQEMGSMRKISDGSKWWMKESESRERKKIAHGGFPAANNTPRWRLKMAKTQTRRSTNCTANTRPSWKKMSEQTIMNSTSNDCSVTSVTNETFIPLHGRVWNKKRHMLLYYPRRPFKSHPQS